MTKDTSKLIANSGGQASSDTDQDLDDLFEDADYAVSDNLEKETIKRDARRKIEIYWEKRRLKEQFDDFDESEFGF